MSEASERASARRRCADVSRAAPAAKRRIGFSKLWTRARTRAKVWVPIPMRTLWLKAAGILLVLWLVIGGVIWLARGARPSPESISRYVYQHPLEGQTPAERDQVMRKLAAQINQLDFEQRREVRMGKKVEGFFKALTPQEQSVFIDLTFPSGFK